MTLKPDFRQAQHFIALLSDNKPITIQTFDYDDEIRARLVKLMAARKEKA